MAIPSVPHSPSNPNQLHPNKVLLSFTALPNIQYWCQSVNIPGVSLGEVPRNTPFIDLYSPGEKLIINTLSLTFLVDEDLKGWIELYTWIRGLTFPVEFKEYADLRNRIGAPSRTFPQFSDAALIILDSKQNAKIRIKFYNCFPTSLSDILLSTTSSPEDPISSDATFRFDINEIERI
jgi:hypothetical protein